MNPRFLRDLFRRFKRARTIPCDEAGALRIDIPVARNRRFVVAAIVFGAPWLLATAAGSITFLVIAPIDPLLIRILAWVVLVLLTIFIHVLAAMSVWGAFYQAHGTEVFVVDDEHVQVLRTALGVTLPARVGRLGIHRATVLPEWSRRAPQPKIEVKSGKGAVRFGAGTSWLEAEAIADRVNAYFSAEEEARALTDRDDLR